jgi:pyruvate/2-oxoglutarate dehydrogenase complex dihydrolipoamide acyltransferase (E2) component
MAPEIANLQKEPAPSPPQTEPSAQTTATPKEAAAAAQSEPKAEAKPQPDAMAKALKERDEYKERVGRLEKEVAKLASLLLAKKQDGQGDAYGQHSKRKSKKLKKDKAKETADAKVEASTPPPVQPQKSEFRTVNVRSVVQAEGEWTARLELERLNGQTSQRVVRVGDVVAGMAVQDISWKSVVLTGDSGRQTVLRID